MLGHTNLGWLRLLPHETAHRDIILILCRRTQSNPAPQQPLLSSTPFATQNKKLKAQLKYGPMQVFRGNYLSSTNQIETWKKLSSIVEQNMQQYE
jgi:hypothetical protein